MSPLPSRRGFTLLEVMVALAILAGALVVASDVVSGALRNHVRAQHLEVATLLARGKMAALEDHYEAKGFRVTDEHDEGSFDEEGHPEVKWRLDVTVPPLEATPESVLRALTGGADQSLKDLLPSSSADRSKGQGQTQAQPVSPYQAMIAAALQNVLARLGQQLKQGVRQLQLTVSWPEGAKEESFTVTTQMAVLRPGEQLGK